MLGLGKLRAQALGLRAQGAGLAQDSGLRAQGFRTGNVWAWVCGF